MLSNIFVCLLLLWSAALITAADDKEERGWDFIDKQLKLAYGSMLNMSCLSSEDCFLKHSVCNPLTKRCECDHQSMVHNDRCQVRLCSMSEECSLQFDNSICLFGRCQCIYGLRVDGKCATIPATGKALPEWAISLIALGALFGGIYSGRSQVVGQVFRHLITIVALLGAGGGGAPTRSNTAAGQVGEMVVQAMVQKCNEPEQPETETCPRKSSTTTTTTAGVQTVSTVVGTSNV